MTRHPVIEFTVRTDIVVVGYNPENADMTNPRGAQYGFAACVQSQSEYGETFELFVVTKMIEADAEAAAQRLADALNARLAGGKLPVGFASWREGRPCYGSQAYVDFGQADDVALERREEEEAGW